MVEPDDIERVRDKIPVRTAGCPTEKFTSNATGNIVYLKETSQEPLREREKSWNKYIRASNKKKSPLLWKIPSPPRKRSLTPTNSTAKKLGIDLNRIELKSDYKKPTASAIAKKLETEEKLKKLIKRRSKISKTKLKTPKSFRNSLSKRLTRDYVSQYSQEYLRRNSVTPRKKDEKSLERGVRSRSIRRFPSKFNQNTFSSKKRSNVPSSSISRPKLSPSPIKITKYETTPPVFESRIISKKKISVRSSKDQEKRSNNSRSVSRRENSTKSKNGGKRTPSNSRSISRRENSKMSNNAGKRTPSNYKSPSKKTNSNRSIKYQPNGPVSNNSRNISKKTNSNKSRKYLPTRLTSKSKSLSKKTNSNKSRKYQQNRLTSNSRSISKKTNSIKSRKYQPNGPTSNSRSISKKTNSNKSKKYEPKQPYNPQSIKENIVENDGIGFSSLIDRTSIRTRSPSPPFKINAQQAHKTQPIAQQPQQTPRRQIEEENEDDLILRFRVRDSSKIKKKKVVELVNRRDEIIYEPFVNQESGTEGFRTNSTNPIHMNSSIKDNSENNVSENVIQLQKVQHGHNFEAKKPRETQNVQNLRTQPKIKVDKNTSPIVNPILATLRRDPKKVLGLLMKEGQLTWFDSYVSEKLGYVGNKDRSSKKLEVITSEKKDRVGERIAEQLPRSILKARGFKSDKGTKVDFRSKKTS